MKSVHGYLQKHYSQFPKGATTQMSINDQTKNKMRYTHPMKCY